MCWEQGCQTYIFNYLLLLTIYLFGSRLYQSISKDISSYLPGTFPGLKSYSHFYYNYFTIYSCFNYNFTGGANADNYTVSGMAFEKLLLQAFVIVIVEVDIVIFLWNSALVYDMDHTV